MSYKSAVHQYCCALEAQLRTGLGRDLKKYVEDPAWGWDGPAVNERPKFPYTYTLREFQICLSKKCNKRILLDLLGSVRQVDRALSGFLIDKLPTEIKEIADCRPPVAHGDPSPQRDPERRLKVRRILLHPEEEGGPATVKLARSEQYRRTHKP